MNDKKQDQPGIGSFFGNVAKNVSNKVTDLAGKTTDAVAHGKTAVEQALDVNGDGKIDIEDIIILSLRIPGVRIVREDFLRTEFKKRFPQEVIDDAVLYTPAHAGIAVEEIDKTIAHLEKTKKALLSSARHLESANSKAEDMTLKKLTRGNRTMQKKFKDAGVDITTDCKKDAKKDADNDIDAA